MRTGVLYEYVDETRSFRHFCYFLRLRKYTYCLNVMIIYDVINTENEGVIAPNENRPPNFERPVCPVN